MEHVWHECDDENCVVCSGGLAQCTVCGEAEGWLPTECPGEKIPFETGELIGRRLLDFVNGEWTPKTPCPRCGGVVRPLDVDHAVHEMSAANEGWDGVCIACSKLWKEDKPDGESAKLDD